MFFNLFKKSRISDLISPDKSIFKQKYSCFQRLLSSNNVALEIIADLEYIIYQDKTFTHQHILSQTEALICEVYSIAEDLNALSELKYPELFPSTERISCAIISELKKKRTIAETSLVIPLEKLSLEDIDDVGGKAANLGEVYNRVNLPVPPTFAITAYAYQQFMSYNNLLDFVDQKLIKLDVNDMENLTVVSQEIQLQILKANPPPDLEKSMLYAAQELCRKVGQNVRFSVRSSASSEDTEASFAGQHSTVLNVGTENLIHAYREVVASNFNPRAIFYRRSRGYLDQDVTMSVACVEMINAKVSGVMYTVDPNDSRHAVIMISAVWGLAVIVVEGSTANDFYQIDKKTGEIEVSEIAVKEFLLRPDSIDGLKEEKAPDHMKNSACLDNSQIRELVAYGIKLERHYGFALDIEWAIDHNGRLYILQSRPLRRSQKFGAEEAAQNEVKAPESSVSDHEILLKGGASASDGTACGLAYVLQSDHIFHHVPEGAILITRQTSPRYVPLMGRVRAIITDVGSVTGHMASVAREFQIPTLVGTGSATEIIPHGEEITVDATNRTVYRGRVENLLKYKKPVNPMKGSPIYKTMQTVLKKIAPLNLTDPKLENFRPEACQTIHDVIRFAHEMAMQEMFHMREDVEPEKTVVIPLQVKLPLKIHIIDLGKGLTIIAPAKEATVDNITSVPFKALLKGMTHKDIDWAHHAGASWRGFGRIVAESIFRDPLKEGEIGGPSYAIIAGRYLNFSARMGYHFATVDTYCGPKINDNYITFYFKGGAADIARRSRRALLIALILKQLGFKVEQKGDMVRAEIKKYDSKRLKEKLDMLGRMLGAVRLLDMVLSDDQQVEWYAQQFFSGNYTFHVAGT